MSYYRLKDGIEPETWEVIRPPEDRYCDCAEHPKDPLRFHLCDYHDGFDEGAAAMKARQGENP